MSSQSISAALPATAPPTKSDVRNKVIGCAVVAVVGVVFVVLGATNLFGDVGSAGFVASIVCGGVVTILGVGGIIFVVTRKPPLVVPTQIEIDLQAMKKFCDELNVDVGNRVPHWNHTNGNIKIGPTNKELIRYGTLYNHFFAKLDDLLKNQRRSFTDPDVIATADHALKLGYMIAILTLDELETISRMPHEPHAQEYSPLVTAINRQDCYTYKAMYYCSRIYQIMRLGFGYNDNIPPTQEPFYQQGTDQNHWRMIHNDYCNKVLAKLPQKDLEPEGYLFGHTHKDETPDYKGPLPGYLEPT